MARGNKAGGPLAFILLLAVCWLVGSIVFWLCDASMPTELHKIMIYHLGRVLMGFLLVVAAPCIAIEALKKT